MDVYEAEGSSRACIIVAGYPDAGFERHVGCTFKDFAPVVAWAKRIAAAGVTAITYSNVEGDLHAVVSEVRARGYEDIALWASSGNAPLAVSMLMRDSRVNISRTALFYPYTLSVPDEAKKFGFATPANERSAKDLAPTPLFIVRAGRDEMPRLNATLDGFVRDALAANLPVTLLNDAESKHGAETPYAITQCLSFLSGSSNSMRLPNGSST